MTTVTSEAVWTKIGDDAEFLQQPEAVREATRPYVEALPNVLADSLDQPANLNNTMRAKFLFLRYCVDNGFIKAAVEAMPEEALGFLDREDMFPMLESALAGAIEMADELTGDISALLEENGVTEDEVMLSPKVGFNTETAAMYRAGELTIGELLVAQPMIIVKNS